MIMEHNPSAIYHFFMFDNLNIFNYLYIDLVKITRKVNKFLNMFYMFVGFDGLRFIRNFHAELFL